jgi:FAD synthase
LRLEFSHRLRGEERFASVEELTAQVHRDIAAVRAYAHTAAVDPS